MPRAREWCDKKKERMENEYDNSANVHRWNRLCTGSTKGPPRPHYCRSVYPTSPSQPPRWHTHLRARAQLLKNWEENGLV